MSTFQHAIGARLTYTPSPDRSETETFGVDDTGFLDKAGAQVTVERQYDLSVNDAPPALQYRVTDGAHKWIALEAELT